MYECTTTDMAAAVPRPAAKSGALQARAGAAGATPAGDERRRPSPEFEDLAAAVGGPKRKSEDHT